MAIPQEDKIKIKVDFHYFGLFGACFTPKTGLKNQIDALSCHLLIQWGLLDGGTQAPLLVTRFCFFSPCINSKIRQTFYQYHLLDIPAYLSIHQQAKKLNCIIFSFLPAQTYFHRVLSIFRFQVLGGAEYYLQMTGIQPVITGGTGRMCQSKYQKVRQKAARPWRTDFECFRICPGGVNLSSPCPEKGYRSQFFSQHFLFFTLPFPCLVHASITFLS